MRIGRWFIGTLAACAALAATGAQAMPVPGVVAPGTNVRIQFYGNESVLNYRAPKPQPNRPLERDGYGYDREHRYGDDNGYGYGRDYRYGDDRRRDQWGSRDYGYDRDYWREREIAKEQAREYAREQERLRREWAQEQERRRFEAEKEALRAKREAEKDAVKEQRRREKEEHKAKVREGILERQIQNHRPQGK